MGTSGQKIRRFYYTRYRNSKQRIFASQYENIQLKFISQQGFPFTCSGQERIYRVGAGWIATAWTGGASRGAKPLWLWVSNRGEQHPCWHTILLAKSSVLYLLRPLTLERGCPTPDRPFSVAAEQADFVGCKIHKMKDLP